jgi:hypothetical protein
MYTWRSWAQPWLCRSERDKYTAWGVRSQGWNSKELTGTRTSSGACGLIRCNAKNLTWAWHTGDRVRDDTFPQGTPVQVLHGCRQLVPWGVGLSPATSATLVISCQHVKVGTLMRLPRLTRRKVRMTSSPHGPYAQGYTRATMVGTEGGKTARWSKSPKPAPVQIVVCNSTTWRWNC